MKLPGIQYGRQVQSLGREDVSAPLRVAGAEAAASKAWARTMYQGQETIEGIGDMIAKEDNAEAMNIYNTLKPQWLSDQNPLDDDTTPAWVNGMGRFNDADEKARKEAMDGIRTEQGRVLFNKNADEANVRYGNAWHSKVQNWHDEDSRSNMFEAADIYQQNREFDIASDIYADMHERGLITTAQYNKAESINTVMGIHSDFDSRTDAAGTANDYLAIRQDIEAQTQINEKAKEGLQLDVDNRIIEVETGVLRELLTDIESTMGLAAAAEYGELISHASAQVTEPTEHGLVTEKAMQSKLNAMRQVAREWNYRDASAKSGAKRTQGIDCAVYNTCLATSGKSDVQAIHNDWYEIALGRTLEGKTGVNNNGVENSVILGADEVGEQKRDAIVGVYGQSGYVGKSVKNVFDAAFTQNSNPKLLDSGISLYQRMLGEHPSGVLRNQSGVLKEYQDILIAFDNDPQTAARIIRGHQQGAAELEMSKDAFNEVAFDQDGFDQIMKDHMPDEGFFWNSTPEYRNTYRIKMQERARLLMPLVGNNPNSAYVAAVRGSRGEYGVDPITDQVVKTPVQSNVINGDKGDGAWFHNYIKDNIGDFNIDEDGSSLGVPDNYQYHPLPNFDPVTNPGYSVSWIDDKGMFRAVKFVAKFEETPEGKEFINEEANRMREIERSKMDTIKRARLMSDKTGEYGASIPQMKRLELTSQAAMDTLGRWNAGNYKRLGRAIDVGFGKLEEFKGLMTGDKRLDPERQARRKAENR